jgi:hypothetical protein
VSGWWTVKDPSTLDINERDRFSRLKRMDPRSKMAEARRLNEMADQEMRSGDYNRFNEMQAEARALEDWAERELQGYDY